MYNISSALYNEVAGRLTERIGRNGYFSGSLAFESADVECRLVLSAVVYHDREVMPEGETHTISDLVPVWWEFHLNDPEGEQETDFDWNLLNAKLEERF